MREIKNNPNQNIQEQLKGLKLSSETFQSGAIYLTNDTNVLFPTRKKVKDKPRMVVVMGQDKDLNDPMIPQLYAVPITTSFDLESTQDLPVEKGEGNLDKSSLIKMGMIQPILKTNLGRKVGNLGPDMHDQLKASAFMVLGLGEGLEEDEVEDTVKDEG